MQAPKLRSMFRNVRTEPRRFVFRSRHLPELDAKWSERKEQIEAELAEQPAPETANNRPIRFQSANRPSSSDLETAAVALKFRAHGTQFCEQR